MPLLKRFILVASVTVVLAILIPRTVGRAAGSLPGKRVQQALEAIHECMQRTPTPWPQAWRREYIETIRQAMPANPQAESGTWHLTAPLETAAYVPGPTPVEVQQRER